MFTSAPVAEVRVWHLALMEEEEEEGEMTRTRTPKASTSQTSLLTRSWSRSFLCCILTAHRAGLKKQDRANFIVIVHECGLRSALHSTVNGCLAVWRPGPSGMLAGSLGRLAGWTGTPTGLRVDGLADQRG